MEEGKVVIEARDSGSVRISLKPAEDGSIWMSIAGIYFLLAVLLWSVKLKRFLQKGIYGSMQ